MYHYLFEVLFKRIRCLTFPSYSSGVYVPLICLSVYILNSTRFIACLCQQTHQHHLSCNLVLGGYKQPSKSTFEIYRSFDIMRCEVSPSPKLTRINPVPISTNQLLLDQMFLIGIKFNSNHKRKSHTTSMHSITQYILGVTTD